MANKRITTLVKENLKGLSGQTLEEQVTKIQTVLAKVLADDKKKNLAEARRVIAKFAEQHGYTLQDMIETGTTKTKPKGQKKKSNPPKYANPDDSTQTWTGQGRPPKWFVENQDAGITSAEMDINQTQSGNVIPLKKTGT